MQAEAEHVSQRRYAALAASGLLDGEPERRFDRLTRIVAAALRVPSSMISLVDVDRQFFTSAVGLHESLQDKRETPLSHSFCRHVVASEAPLVVNDSREHALVSGNPAIEEFGVAAYIGMPIADRDGVVIGSLCAIDSSPRFWQDADLNVLADVAALVEREIAERRDSDATTAAAQKWSALLNALPQLVWAAQPDGRTAGFNDRWHQFTGVADDRDWTEFAHPDDAAMVQAAWRDAVATRVPLEIEFRLRDAGGEYHQVLARAVAVRNDHGEVEQWVGSCTDIQVTRRTADQTSKALACSLIERLSERAAYARGEDFAAIRDVIRDLRKLTG